MRDRYLIVYDISSSKRRYYTHKYLSAYAVGGQKSFYECWLTNRELVEFKQKLINCIDKQEDKLFIFQLNKDTQPQLFGCASLPKFNQPYLII
ncbi:CRISPR-associated endonuclease Cas2 [[Mannheimia] succiniciproducens]|uniref:CRISPR-associated endoribonuclease Cas2 n=1 Tax=Mannheimia succiniciproducens (strain KCTC 0769BP / MBEL55E) TaxID=221988 RepID=Q65S17_MANSM|nr:CRISPR-associated endonuclease Cas2 [[Mannheimia] succiniciproducens]AAU38243.1 unknown [[Mannheimia] succiniciproducens MBEL55E]